MYQKITLPYQLSELSPFLSERTMKLHYDDLYLGYLNRLNRVLEKNKFTYSYPKEELFDRITDFPIQDRDDILYNAGGVINHEVYFLSISKEQNIELKEPLKSVFLKLFGTMEVFYNRLMEQSLSFAGSGYTFLVVNANKGLQLISQSNQDTPYLFGMTPIMAIDIWEHAYYLDFTTAKKDYIEGFLSHINWDTVNDAYQKAMK